MLLSCAQLFNAIRDSEPTEPVDEIIHRVLVVDLHAACFRGAYVEELGAGAQAHPLPARSDT